MSVRNPFETSQKLLAEQHRLDQLSWLIEGSSMCTSSAVVKNNFYIAANEFSASTRSRENNQQLDFICKVMEYFSETANKLLSEEDIEKRRDELMVLICLNQINTATFGRIVVPEDVLQTVVCSKILLTEELPKNVVLPKEKDTAYFALAFGLNIYRRIRKIENSIKGAKSGDFSEINREQLEAFKNFKHTEKKKSNILFVEPSKGVHAEMQILSKIIEGVEKGEITPPQEIYIGISKRCCLNCHYMLDAANETLKDRGLKIKFEGSHDADFSSGWIPPNFFLKGIKSVKKRKGKGKSAFVHEEDEDTLAFKIGRKYAEEIQTAKSSKSYEQRHSRSSSEYSQTAAEQLAVFESKIEADLKVYKQRGDINSEAAKMLTLGIDLCKTEQFRQLFDLFEISDEIEEVVTKRLFSAILTELNKGRQEENRVSNNFLLGFLTNPSFSGEKIAASFSKISESHPISERRQGEEDFKKVESKSPKKSAVTASPAKPMRGRSVSENPYSILENNSEESVDKVIEKARIEAEKAKRAQKGRAGMTGGEMLTRSKAGPSGVHREDKEKSVVKDPKKTD